MEDIAENYLNELIHRSMVQAVGNGSCRLHDVMRDLAQSIAEEDNFCMFSHGKDERQDFKARRLSIQFNGGDISRSSASMSQLRSFFVFGKDVIPSSSLNRISSTCRQLRVLCLEDASIDRVPDELVNLFNLRFLSLRNTKVQELPKSLVRLRNLETLDIRESKVEKLPDWIKKMKQLRHLYTYRSAILGCFYVCGAPPPFYRTLWKGVQAPSRICDLNCLQSLLSVEANAEIVQQVGNLTQLRELGITKVRKDYGKKLCSSIQRMKGLRVLSIAVNNGETLQMEELSAPPHGLQRLRLEGHMEKLPQWIASLRNLTYLCLELSELKEDPLLQIGPLPNLLVLRLSSKAYIGQQLCFVVGCFPRLKELYLRELENLNHVRIKQGAMPNINLINFSRCVKLTTLPKGIEHLSGLRHLRLTEMPEELIEQLEKGGSEVQKMVQHIPIIQNTFRILSPSGKGGKWVSEDFPHLFSQQENGLERPQIAPSMDVGEAKNFASMSFHVRAGLFQVVGYFFALSLLIWLLFTLY